MTVCRSLRLSSNLSTQIGDAGRKQRVTGLESAPRRRRNDVSWSRLHERSPLARRRTPYRLRSNRWSIPDEPLVDPNEPLVDADEPLVDALEPLVDLGKLRPHLTGELMHLFLQFADFHTDHNSIVARAQ